MSIAAASEQTGIAKEVLRKWEVRYGFPIPERDANGRRKFSPEQVSKLEIIKALLDRGMRTRHLVPLPLEALTAMLLAMRPLDQGTGSELGQRLIHCLQGDDPRAVGNFLKDQLASLGLRGFVSELIPMLNVVVGDAWASGHISVNNEHLYTASLKLLLGEQITTLIGSATGARVLLATAPGEAHTLGLLMAHVILGLEGANCISLGANLASDEIVMAAAQYRVAVVGLSFSDAYPTRKMLTFLEKLRQGLPSETIIWAGGAGASRLPENLTGVLALLTLGSAVAALQDLNQPRGSAASAIGHASHLLNAP